MNKWLLVDDLPVSVTEGELRGIFERYGAVQSVDTLTDRETGQSRGHGFVEMAEAGAAADAIEILDSTQLKGRGLTVKVARQKQPRGLGAGISRRQRS